MTESPDQLDLDRPLPVAARSAKRAKGGGGASAVLGAAMLAVGEILEPEKARVEVVESNDDRGDDGLELDFGHLPGID